MPTSALKKTRRSVLFTREGHSVPAGKVLDLVPEILVKNIVFKMNLSH